MKPLLLVVLAPLVLAAGAANPGIAGVWNCVATDTLGKDTRWTLAVKQDGGALGATLTSVSDGSVVPLVKPTLEGDRFSFTFPINETESIEVLLTLNGDRLEGRWGGTNIGAGLFKATRAGILNVSGTWTGEWEVDPDGKRQSSHYMVLKQDGMTVTGTCGPSPEQQAAIRNGRVAGDKLTFEIGIPYGPTMAFSFKVAGQSMSGEAVLTITGSERRFRLAARAKIAE